MKKVYFEMEELELINESLSVYKEALEMNLAESNMENNNYGQLISVYSNIGEMPDELIEELKVEEDLAALTELYSYINNVLDSYREKENKNPNWFKRFLNRIKNN